MFSVLLKKANHNSVDKYKLYDFVALLTSLVIFVFYVLTIRPGQNWGDDFSQYVIHAKNIVNGTPYKHTGHIINKIYSIAPETYPPVFPFLLAPIYYFFDLNIDAFKIVPILCYVGFLILYYYNFRHAIKPYFLIFTMVFMALNPYIWDFKDWILSEFPFMFFVFLSISIIMRNRDYNHNIRKALLWYGIIGISIYLVIGTRTIGVVLIPSFILYELIKKPKHKFWYILMFTALAVTGGLLYLQKLYLNSEGEGYLYQLEQYFSFDAVLKNIDEYINVFITFWCNNEAGKVADAIFYILLITTFLGYIMCIWKRITIIEIFLPAYIIGTFLWPMYQGMRSLMLVMPFFLIYSLYFVFYLKYDQLKLILQASLSTILGILFFSYFLYQINFDYNQDMGHIETPDSEEFFTFVRYTPREARFLFDKPRALTLYTGRSAGVSPYCTDKPEDLGKYMYITNISYLALFRWDTSCAIDFVNKYPDVAQKAFENNTFVVYKIFPKKFE